MTAWATAAHDRSWLTSYVATSIVVLVLLIAVVDYLRTIVGIRGAQVAYSVAEGLASAETPFDGIVHIPRIHICRN